MTREQAIEIARAAAKARRPSYYAEPFEPHAWVVDAILAGGAELERKVEEYRTLWSQEHSRRQAYERELARRDQPTGQDLEEVDAEDKAPPAVAGYMHEYPPAVPRPRAANEVLPPERRASWARGKTPHDR